MSEATGTTARDILKFAGMTLLALVAATALYVVWAGDVRAHRLLYTGCTGDRTSLAEHGYEAQPIAFRSEDGIELHGWFTPGREHPEIAIVVLPGQGANTCYALPEANLLADAGYSTLVYEHRACADPLVPGTTGLAEAHDLLGAVEYLAGRGDIEHIGALGFLEGATASILAAAEEPRIEAVVAVGSYATLESRILEPGTSVPWHERLARQLTLWFVEREGVAPAEARPVDVVGAISPRPLLLIHGGCDEADGLALASAANPATTQLWVVPAAGRGGLAQFEEAAYRERIVGFFDAAFKLETASAP